MKTRFYLIAFLLLGCASTEHEQTWAEQREADRAALVKGPCHDMALTVNNYGDRPTPCPRIDQRGEVVPGSGGWNDVKPTLLCKCIAPAAAAPSASTR